MILVGGVTLEEEELQKKVIDIRGSLPDSLKSEEDRRELWRGLGFASLEDFLVRSWEAGFVRRDMRDLLAQLRTWQLGDISANDLYRGDLHGRGGDDVACVFVRAHRVLCPLRSISRWRAALSLSSCVTSCAISFCRDWLMRLDNSCTVASSLFSVAGFQTEIFSVKSSVLSVARDA